MREIKQIDLFSETSDINNCTEVFMSVYDTPKNDDQIGIKKNK